MPGTLTFVDTKLRTVRRLEFDWLSDASGDMSGTPSAVVSGVLERIVTIPDGGGTAPTTLYDVVLNDADGLDVLNGAGANLSATVSAQVGPALTGGQMAIDGVLDLVVSNAGNAKGGTVVVIVGPV